MKSRRDLWQVFISRACSQRALEWLDDDCLDHLASEELNGRQIKNAVRTAQALALSDDCELKVEHIDQSLTAMNMFEADFAENGFAGAEGGLRGEEPSGAEPSLKRQRIS